MNSQISGYNPNLMLAASPRLNNRVLTPCVAFTSQPDTVSLSTNNPVQETKRGLSHKAKLGIGGLALVGIGAVAYILSRGRVGSKQVQQLAEHIEFKEAATMEEAIKFAKEHLGIKKFDVGNDLEIANWVNNGLTRISNKYKGKAPIPHIVETYPVELYQQAIKESDGLPMADINAFTGRMRVNTHYFNDAKKSIQKYMDAMGIKVGKPDANGLSRTEFNVLPFMNIKKQTDLLPLLVKIAEGKASKMEILTCEIAIGDMFHFNKLLYEQPELIYSHVLKSPKLNNILSAKKDINVLTLDKFKTLTKEEQINYMYNLNDEVIKGKTGDELFNIFSEIRIADRQPNVYHVIDHEMGHSLHFQAVGKNEYKVTHTLSDSEKKVAATISDYATTNSHEFVAEVHAELAAGHTVSSEVMELYKKYGGAIPA